MDNYNEEYCDMQPSAMGKFFKLALMRMVVFGLIGAILMGVICLFINAFAVKNAKVTAMIEYNYDGIEAGRDPLGNKFIAANDITSIDVLSDAINSSASYKNIDLQKLKSQMSVTGVMPEETAKLLASLGSSTTMSDAQISQILNQLSAYSSRYVISINNPSELNLSTSSAQDLLSTILTSYSKIFEEKFYSLVLEGDIFTEETVKQYEYVEIGDVYQTQMTRIQNILSKYQQQYPTFVSSRTKLDFTSLLTNMKTVSNSVLEKYNSTILVNGIAKEKDIIDEYFQYQIDRYDSLITEQSNMLVENKKTIDAYAKMPIIVIPSPDGSTPSIEIPVPSGIYDALVRQYNTDQQLLSQYRTTKTLYEKKKTMFNTASEISPELIARADKEVQNLVVTMSSIITQANGLITDLHEYEKISNTFQITASPAKYSESVLDFLQIVLLVFVGLIVGVIAAMIVVAAKRTAFNNKKSATAPALAPAATSNLAIAATVEQPPTEKEEKSEKK